MNILWISFLGSWTLPLLKTIKQTNHVGIIIPIIDGKENLLQEKDGICFYSLALSSKECYTNMDIETYYKYKKIIDTFKPDIIHIHGTEKNLAQIQNFIKDIPIVISIQGLLIGCKPYTYNFVEKKIVHKFRSIKNLFGKGGLKLMYKVVQRGTPYETDILNNGKYFFGRTNWDRAYIMFHNPKAHYFTGEELLRESFYDNAGTWKINQCTKHSIFMPSGFNPIKGMHLAIETIYLLKQYYPNVLLVIPGIPIHILQMNRLSRLITGEEFITYIQHKIHEYNIEDNIRFLPRLDAIEMAEQMKKANVFLSPSSIDNSPNAIGEAMLIGTPIVSTPVGGVTSFLEDESSTLFAPAGDPYMMAYQIKRIFDDENLAATLSNNAHQIALKRHNKENTVKQYIDTYKKIISLRHQSTEK